MSESSARWSKDTKRLVALFGIILVGLAIYRFNFVLGPLAIAILLSYLLSPIAAFLQKRLRFRRTTAVVLPLLLVLAGLVLLSVLLVQAIVAQLQSLQLDLTEIGSRLSEFLAQPLVIGDLRIDLQQVFEQLRGSLNSLLQPIVDRAVSFGGDLAEGFVWLIFVFVASLYLLKDWNRIGPWLEGVVPPAFRGDFVRLRAEIAQTWNNFFRGQLALGITMGVVVGLAMWAVGLPNALIIGVLFGVLEVVPNFGPIIASIPTVLIALFQGSTWMFIGNNLAFAVVVIVVCTALQQIENVVLVPRILGHHLNLHPVAVLVAVIAGASLAGVLGILLASPILATLRDIGRYVFARMLDRDPFPPAAAPTP